MMPTITSSLCDDQPTATDESIILIMKGRPWYVRPEPRAITTVASIKMSVVIPNMNRCPRERNKDPLDLKDGEHGF